jgi:hypothetical protein
MVCFRVCSVLWRLASVTLLLVLALAALPSVSLAQQGVCPSNKGLEPVAFETLTVSSTPIGFTAATINATTAAGAFVTVEAQPLRATFIGTPSATVGHLVEPPPTGNADSTRGFWVCGRTALLGFRMIRTGGTDATVRVTYYKAR